MKVVAFPLARAAYLHFLRIGLGFGLVCDFTRTGLGPGRLPTLPGRHLTRCAIGLTSFPGLVPRALSGRARDRTAKIEGRPPCYIVFVVFLGVLTV